MFRWLTVKRQFHEHRPQSSGARHRHSRNTGSTCYRLREPDPTRPRKTGQRRKARRKALRFPAAAKHAASISPNAPPLARQSHAPRPGRCRPTTKPGSAKLAAMRTNPSTANLRRHPIQVRIGPSPATPSGEAEGRVGPRRRPRVDRPSEVSGRPSAGTAPRPDANYAPGAGSAIGSKPSTAAAWAAVDTALHASAVAPLPPLGYGITCRPAGTQEARACPA